MNIMRQCCIETPARVSQTLGQSQITASYEGGWTKTEVGVNIPLVLKCRVGCG
ncbi:hypothetical protein BJX61DRAFT_492730 [Aspergillus egyptiacus]|nr:hypothetical protein BJX61DRAFT_492730 [Aspergillus egyptiacus]